jgi:hypothetical protein
VEIKKGMVVFAKGERFYKTRYQVLDVYRNVSNPDDALVQVSFVDSTNSIRYGLVPIGAVELVPPLTLEAE